jgi:hypothetical protein
VPVKIDLGRNFNAYKFFGFAIGPLTADQFADD